MTVDDAANVVSWAREDAPDDIDVHQLVTAASMLAARVRELERELERARAVVDTSATGRRHHEGAELLEGTDLGGRRHFLAGLPVHAGTGLYLLTHIGWLAGRYEWNWRPGSMASFYFSLPGVDPEIALPVLPGARLAWPGDICKP